MKKFLKILKWIFTLGVGLILDYRKERSKTRVLIENINQLLEVGAKARDAIERKKPIELVSNLLKAENLKILLSTYQSANGLYHEISADVEALKKEKK